MNRKIISVLLAAAMAGSMGICAGAEDASSDPITIWTFADQHEQYYNWAAEKYKETHPDVEINVELIPYDSLNEKLQVISASEGEECPDLVDMEQGTFPRYMTDEENMIFEPLDSWFEAENVLEKASEGRMSLYKANGHFYGIDLGACPVTMMYREDLYEQCGVEVPTTWEEFKAAAEVFAENGIYILAEQDLSFGATALANDISTLLKAAGADYVDENGNLNLGDEFRTILADFIEMQQNDYFFAYQSEDEIWPVMAQDQIATYFAADWAIGRIRDNEPEQSGKWKLAPLPKFNENSAGISVCGGTGCCMMKYTDKDKDQLWDLMKFMHLDKDNLVERYNMIAMYPIVYDAMAECTGEVEYLGGQDQAALYESMAHDIPSQYQAPWRGAFADTFAANGYDLYEGNMSIDEFCDALTETVENYGK